MITEVTQQWIVSLKGLRNEEIRGRLWSHNTKISPETVKEMGDGMVCFTFIIQTLYMTEDVMTYLEVLHTSGREKTICNYLTK